MATNLFLAEVTNVYPQRVVLKTKLNTNLEAEVQHEAYTVDVKPYAGRLEIQGVRVLSTTSGTIAANGSGFVWMPDIGDWVVCGYLEGYRDYPIVLGAMKHPFSNTINSAGEGYQDFTMFHQSGSYIRMRDLSKYNNPSSNVSTSEIMIHHKTGAKIEFCETSENEVEINITHPSGSSIKMDSEGNIELNGNTQQAVWGTKLKQRLDALEAWINSHNHNGNIGYPTTPPLKPFTDTTPYLSENVKLGE